METPHPTPRRPSFLSTLKAWIIALFFSAFPVLILAGGHFPIFWHATICLGPFALIVGALGSVSPSGEITFCIISYTLLFLATHTFLRLPWSWLWLAAWLIIGAVITWNHILANFVT